jgi:hypothetical protein
MIAAVTLQRLALRWLQEWMRKALVVWTGGMKMTRRGVRSCSALSGSGYHGYGAHL